MRKQFPFASLVCLPLIACGGSDNNSKTVKVPDAGAKAVDAAAACKAAASYTLGNKGNATDYPAKANGSGMVAHAQVVVNTLGSDSIIFLQLNGNFGSFGSGDIKPGTYAISGDDLDPSACGLCFYVWPNSFDSSTNRVVGVDNAYLAAEQYMAVSGSVTLTQAGGSAGSGSGHQVGGTVSNVTFKHATITTDQALTYNTDGCTTSIASGTFGLYNLSMGSAAVAADSTGQINRLHTPSDGMTLSNRVTE